MTELHLKKKSALLYLSGHNTMHNPMPGPAHCLFKGRFLKVTNVSSSVFSPLNIYNV